MYDKSKAYPVLFFGGPYDGQTFLCVPADRLVWEERTPKGIFLKKHIYQLREIVNRETGEVVKLEYHYL